MAVDPSIPVLRKEELITILEAFFRFSQEENNAFQRKPDGLYVRDFYQAFLSHIQNESIHATNQALEILDDFTLENGILCYNGDPVVVNVSQDQGNAVQVRQDGLYIPDLSTVLTQHLENTNIHVTAEDKATWNSILASARTYTDTMIQALEIYNYQLVSELPAETSSADAHTIYCVEDQLGDQTFYTRYIYRNDQWICLDLPSQIYQSFVSTDYLEQNYVNLEDESVHGHNNLETLAKFSESNNRLLFNNQDILDVMQISEDEDNAIFRGSDDKLYVKDLSSELASIATQASLSKTILLDQDCDSAGTYTLEEDISNFNFIMIHYYLMPDDPTLEPYDAKMEMLDTDALTDLYERHIDYILEHDYGVSTYNTKIRFLDRNKMQVTYYNHVCIYKIIGVR